MIDPTRGPAPVFRVGLTGGIATGKSTVAVVFREEGAFVLDADAIGHALMEPGTVGHEAIRQAFGEEVFDADGRIDRRELGAIIFRDSASRLRLNGILHPLILAEETRRIGEFARKSPGGIAVIQAALLVEAGAAKIYDRLVVTHCDRALQTDRLRQRDGMSGEEALRRIKAQADPETRLAEADFVIDTSADLEATRRHAREVFARIRRAAEERIEKQN